MCGIIGYIGSKQLVPILIDGLRRLEYRGYDSAGVAVVRNGAIELRRSAGKLARLEEVIATNPLEGEYGIGHTRWATHGRPTEENAHPHRDCTGRIVVVHNGIIENYLELKHELIAQGHRFATETDTEIVAHLVERESRGETAETRFVSIDKADITGAEVKGKSAQVTVRFVSQLVSVTRDRAGNVIDGNPDKVTDVTDVWTFARDLSSRDPNWKLVATEAGQ